MSGKIVSRRAFMQTAAAVSASPALGALGANERIRVGFIGAGNRATRHYSLLLERHKDAEIIVDTIFDSMVESLAQGERIEIRGFGSFAVKHRAAHEGRNPKTGETVHIPAKRMPLFKVGKELAERINPTAPQQEIS